MKQLSIALIAGIICYSCTAGGASGKVKVSEPIDSVATDIGPKMTAYDIKEHINHVYRTHAEDLVVYPPDDSLMRNYVVVRIADETTYMVSKQHGWQAVGTANEVIMKKVCDQLDIMDIDYKVNYTTSWSIDWDDLLYLPEIK